MKARAAKSMLIVVMGCLLLGCGNSIQHIHDSVKKGKLPDNSAVTAIESIEINAPADKVWVLLADIENWPNWMSNVSKPKLSTSNVEVGTEFELENLGHQVHSTVDILIPNKLIGWAGTASIARSGVIWRLKEMNGKTIVSAEESLDGFLINIFVGEKACSEEILKRLKQLKTAAER